MICHLCRGSQNLVCFYNGKPEYHTCPSCNGFGCRMEKPVPTLVIQVSDDTMKRLRHRAHSLVKLPEHHRTASFLAADIVEQVVQHNLDPAPAGSMAFMEDRR